VKNSNLNLSQELIDWYQINKRELPWRSSKNPYIIWLSEIILQQTRVKQGLPYFIAFQQRFPDVQSLASASQDDVLKLWEGLGYYSRARNMHFAAQQVINDFKGIFPSDYQNLIKLKGVGDYTASAIASITNNEEVAVLDGNVFRVLSRILGIQEPINSTEGIKIFKTQAKAILPSNNTGTHNQAIMEFGALHCLPKNPKCQSCPFTAHCFAFQNDLQQELPVKLKKTKVKTVYMNYLVFIDNASKTIVQQRQNKGIWKGLFDFPLVESTETLSKATIEKHQVFNKIINNCQYSINLYNQQPKKHLLTHRKLLAHFWIIEIDDINHIQIESAEIVDASTISNKAFPVLLTHFIDKFFFFT
jgi:A/G-specific adenine glycosylase